MKFFLFPLALLTIACTNRINAQVKTQTANEVRAMFCGASNEETLSYSDLAKCSEVVSTDKELIIKSFKITYVVPSEKGEKENVMIERKNLGGKFTDENLAVIKSFESKKVTKLFFEEIIATERDGKNERKLNDLLLILK